MTDQRIEKWTRWMDGTIKNNVLTMHLHRHAWREMSGIATRHGHLPESYWWEFLLDTYAATQATAIRRQADTHKDAASLANVLEEMTADPAQLKREWWIGMWTIDDRQFATRTWLNQFGGTVNEHLDPAIPAADAQRLREAAADVRVYVDKHVAHSDASAVSSTITLKAEDLHAVIDVIGSIFKRYYNLLTASSMYTLVPAIQHDWTAVFRVPWIPGTAPER